MMMLLTDRSLLGLAVLLCLAMTACDSAGVEESNPPAVVSPEAFTVDPFEGGSDAATAKGAADDHLTAAALRYLPASVTLGVKYLFIPKLLTEFAVQADPVFRDGAWVWSADHGTEFGPISFTLAGRPDGAFVDWTMTVSGTHPFTGQLEDFVLFRARTSIDGSEGTWELFFPIDGESINVLNAEFKIESPTHKWISFVVPSSAPEFQGYEVRYERDGDLRTFYLNQPDRDQEHTLTWNPVTGIGSIESTNYRDGERYCWDAEGNDTSCPQ